MSQLPSRTANDFFDREYRNYAVYTIENRAIPSLVDGFKPAQRKIAFAANKLWRTGNEKPMKVFQLGGQAAALSFFHHGSLDATIIGMTQGFKNSLPIFQGIGQFGSLRDPSAGAPRYVGVKFNDNFRLLYKDFDLVTAKYEEGEEIEPEFFLPIIPTVLLNGGSGIAVGFATNILNRNPLDLIEATMEVLQKGATTNALSPWLQGFHGPVTSQPNSGGRGWTFSGIYTVKNSTQVEVSEIPPGFTYEKYEAHLESLIEKGIIVSYEDQSSERVRYLLKFPRAKLSEILSEDKLEGILKMHESMTENITTLDEKGKLRVFSSAPELVSYFVGIRLGYYVKRKEKILQNLDHEIQVLGEKLRFLQMFLDGTIVVGNQTKSALVGKLEELGFLKFDGSYDYLLSLPIYSLTAERYKDLQGKLGEKQAERKRVEVTTSEVMYLEDLQELRKKLLPKGGSPQVKAPPVVEAGSNDPLENVVRSWLGEGTDTAEDVMDMFFAKS